MSIFNRDKERFDHLRLNEVTVELVQFIQPEVISGEVGVRQVVWIAAQLTEVLHHQERFVELGLHQVR